MRHVQVLQAHGQTRKRGGVGKAVGDVQRLQRGLGQLVQLAGMREDVLVECLLQQLLDEVLLARGALHVGSVAQAVAGAGVLGGGKAVELVQALREVQTGVRVLHVGGDADLHAADGVDHVLQTVEVHHDEVLDVQAGQRVDRVHRAACGAGQVVAGGVAFGEDGVEHHVVPGADRALAGLAARRVHQGVARNGDEVDVAAVRGDLHHHGGIRLMRALAGVAAADGRVIRAVAGILPHDQQLDRLAGVGIHQLFFLLPLLRNRLDLAVLDRAVDVDQRGGRHRSHEGQRRGQHVYDGVARSVAYAVRQGVARSGILPTAYVGNVGIGSLFVHACEPSCMGQNVLIVRHGVEKWRFGAVSSRSLPLCKRRSRAYSTGSGEPVVMTQLEFDKNKAPSV